MSTYVMGLIEDTDPLYQKHLKVLQVCREANVSLPKETYEFFGGQYENVEIEKLKVDIPAKQFSDTQACADIFEILVSDIPKGVSKIRFINSF